MTPRPLDRSATHSPTPRGRRRRRSAPRAGVGRRPARAAQRPRSPPATRHRAAPPSRTHGSSEIRSPQDDASPRSKTHSEQRDAARAAQQDAQLEALRQPVGGVRDPTNRAVAALLAVEAYRRRPDAASGRRCSRRSRQHPGFAGYPARPCRVSTSPARSSRARSSAVVAVGRAAADARSISNAASSKPASRRRRTCRTSRWTVPPCGSAATGASSPTLLDVSRDHRQSPAHRLRPRHRHVPCSDRLTTPFYGADVAINADGSLVALAGGPAGDLAVYRVARRPTDRHTAPGSAHYPRTSPGARRTAPPSRSAPTAASTSARFAARSVSSTRPRSP